jgi:hypothetical protein
MRVVSSASAKVMSGRMVVSRPASIDFPAPGGPSSTRGWSERLPALHHGSRLETEVMAGAGDLTMLNDAPQPSHPGITSAAWTGREGGIVRARAGGSCACS